MTHWRAVQLRYTSGQIVVFAKLSTLVVIAVGGDSRPGQKPIAFAIQT